MPASPGPPAAGGRRELQADARVLRDRVDDVADRVAHGVALQQDAEELPQVVLSDIEMPRMDGFDLVRNIRADARLRDLPVIMITSRIAQKHRDHATELGVDHYLGKPYSEEDLLALIARYIVSAQAEA